MASTYTELSEQLRSDAKIEQATCELKGIYESRHAEMLREAADAIETLSNSINAYAKANEELAAWKNNAQEWMQKVAEEKEHADRMRVAAHDNAMKERDELRRQIKELRKAFREKSKTEEQAADAPEVCVALEQDTPRILFICDRRQCNDCFEGCKHTSDPRHAKHFEIECGSLREQEY